MAKPDLNSSSSHYSSSTSYPDTYNRQNGNASGRTDVPTEGSSQQNKEAEKDKSNNNSTQGSRVKVPKLQIKFLAPDSGSLSPNSSSRESHFSQTSPRTGAPGPKPEILIGMPGSTLPTLTSPRRRESKVDQPTSPRQQQTEASDVSLPASPRKMLGMGPVPKSFRSPRSEKNDSAPQSVNSLSPREVAHTSAPQTDTRHTTTQTTTTTGTASSNTAENTQHIDPDELLQLLEIDLATGSQSSKPKVELPIDSGMKIMRIRTRVSSRMLGEDPPISPRSTQWSRTKPNTSERIIAGGEMPSSSRSSAISAAVQLYAKTTLDLLKPGKPESIKSLARIDPHIAAANMPPSLMSCYVSKSQASFPIAPLLRQLYKTELEGTQQWKNASQLTQDAIKQCDPAIPYGATTSPRKENETTKLKPLAEAVIDALFPANTNSTSPENNQKLRRLSDSFLTRDFVDNVLFVVDQEVIKRCQSDDSLRINEINAIRYTMVFDLIFTRMTLPMLTRLFPEIPNQSQVWMQSALRESLKNAMPHIAIDFFEQSLKLMPENHRSFINQKAKQEEDFLRKEKEEFLEKRISELKLKSNSSRNMNYYNAIADQKKRRDYTKHNKALYDQVLENLNTEFLDDAEIKIINSEITKKLKIYDQLQTIDHIRQDLLFIFNGFPKDKIGKALIAITQSLHEKVGADTDHRIRRRTVAFDAGLMRHWVGESEKDLSNFGDQTIIHQAVIDTFNYDEEVSVLTTTSPTITTTTTTTATTATITPSVTLAPVPTTADPHGLASGSISGDKISDASEEKTL